MRWPFGIYRVPLMEYRTATSRCIDRCRFSEMDCLSTHRLRFFADSAPKLLRQTTSRSPKRILLVVSSTHFLRTAPLRYTGLWRSLSLHLRHSTDSEYITWISPGGHRPVYDIPTFCAKDSRESYVLWYKGKSRRTAPPDAFDIRQFL